ncbi:MAG: class II aldolase/adducin family protein [Hungatella hathewayi]|nr:class II aldolase/adducin family protein [Hungatella hathewayi]
MDIRKELLKMTQQSYREALFAGTSGNLSYYDRETERMLITPGSTPYETMTEDDLVCMTLDGEILEGSRKPSSEWRMHAEIYRQKPEVRAVIHTHSPYATAFAVNNQEIPVILIEMVPFLGGNVEVAEFALPGTVEVGIEAAKKLKDRYACLMANHGVLAVGESLEQAHTRAIYTEDAAKIYCLALSNGSVKIISDTYVENMKKK